MAELIRHDMPADYTVVATSDQHYGSLAFHADGFAQMVDRIASDPTCYWIHNGDAIEGKPVGHKHFDTRTLNTEALTIDAQMRGFANGVRPIAGKCLAFGYGNHDIYLLRDVDVVRWVCDDLGLPRGGYQTVIDLGSVRMFAYHGRRSLPRGAKDPIQRDANQRAWLVNTLRELYGGAHVMMHGHVHTLHVQPPLEQIGLLGKGDTVRMRHFVEPSAYVVTRDPVTGDEDEREYIPPLARWYCITGTLRRSGVFGAIDYAELGGYAPALMGWQEIRVEAGRVVSIEPVVV